MLPVAPLVIAPIEPIEIMPELVIVPSLRTPVLVSAESIVRADPVSVEPAEFTNTPSEINIAVPERLMLPSIIIEPEPTVTRFKLAGDDE